MAQTTSKDLTVPETVPAEGTIVSVPSAIVAEFISGRHVASLQEDNEEAAKAATQRIVDNALAAGTLDELFNQPTVIHSEDFLAHPFVLKAIDWQASKFKDGLTKFYSVLTVINVDGEQVTVTCSGVTVMAKLFALQKNPRLWAELGDKKLKLTQKDEPTRNGYQPLDLVFADTQ